MRRPGLKLAFVGLLLLLAVVTFTPPSQKLRLGKDLSGGVSLVYTVEIKPGENARQIMSDVISVLKDRVDPNNLYEISMVAQGRDRLEVTMPLPGQHVKDARALYESKLAAIEARRLTTEQIDAAMRLEGDSRTQALTDLSADDPDRRQSLLDLANLFDNAREARQLLESTQASGTIEPDDPRILEMAELAASQELAYDTARDELAASSPSAEQVRTALDRSPVEQRLKIEKGSREFKTIKSPRELAIDELHEKFPNEKVLIDEAIEAYDAYLSVRTTLDDPSDLIRMLRASGVLSFRITVDPGTQSDEAALREEFRERGPESSRIRDRGWYKINRIENWYDDVAGYEALQANPARFFTARGYVVEEWAGDYYMLAWDRKGDRLLQDGSWQVASAFQGQDTIGRRAINFRMDARGSVLLGKLTENHIDDNMAVLLDDQVYTAPNLIGRISSQGQITGQFPPEELSYIIRVLNSGALQSKLSSSPLSQSTVGPELGLDNLRQGLVAGVISLIVVGGFMILYYFRCGVIAVIALGCNAVLLIGAMAANSATFSLPGIAGIILTFGMAVDANVLIFERIREELEDGQDIKAAVRLGFSKALSSIVDGNVTNLIVTVVLANLGTQEIKGFAITLGVGVLTTMFSALIITRLLFAILVDNNLWREIKMLPSSVPAVGKLLSPNVNWLGLRAIFIFVSACFVGLGLVMVYTQRGEMLDTEFRGGTQVTLQFKEDADGNRLKLTRRAVMEKVVDLSEQFGPEDDLRALGSADVLPVDPDADGVSSDRFMIKTTVTDSQKVVDELAIAFRDMIDTRPPLEFDHTDVNEIRLAPVYPLLSVTGVLGEDIGRPSVRDKVSEYFGGAAILIEHINPPRSLDELEARIGNLRSTQDYNDTINREWEVRVLEGSPSSVTSAVLLVMDKSARYQDSPERWEKQVAQREWDLVRVALTTTTTLASVQSFSPAIAETFRAQALVAVTLSLLLITIYIWVRFGSVRYSLAAIVCLIHDVLICIGLIALSEKLYHSPTAEPVARALLILPFKIDLNLIAALLTIIGYSLNDSIIVMDRIRENRGRLPFASAKVINLSINQTVSRTVITSGTTLLALLILYIFGGEGVRGFAFAMLIGVVVGTYSSIAIAAPLVWSSKKHGDDAVKAHDEAETVVEVQDPPA